MMNKERKDSTLEYLRLLGLSPEEAQIFWTLTVMGPLTTLELARKTKINRTKVYRVVDIMGSRRLVKEIKDQYTTRIEAESAERLQEMLKETQTKTRMLSNKFEVVMGDLAQLSAKERSDTAVHFYRGPEGIKQMVWNTLKATSEIVGYTYLSFESAVGEEFVEEYYAEFYRRNLRMRDILSDNYLRSMRESSQSPKTYRLHPNWRTHIDSRYIGEKELPIPHQMDIYDDTVGIYSWQEGEIFGVEIKNPKVAAFQRSLFEQTWSMAKPRELDSPIKYDNKIQVDAAFLLSRTTLPLSQFHDLLREIEKIYPVGKIVKSEPLVYGYEDANFLLKTDHGRYALKIFASDMERTYVAAHGKIIGAANKLKIPSPKILQAREGDLITETMGQFVMITEMFEGESFAKKPPEMKDMLAVTRAIAKLNQRQEKLVVGYDSWGNANLMREYKRDQDRVGREVKDLIKPVLDQLRKIDTTTFTHGLIHGDIQPNHVLKNERGEYCILDFGVARYDAVVSELSTHLAWFCLSKESWGNYDKIVGKILTEYTKVIKLGREEIATIPLLIAASYAAYYFRTSILIGEGDNSQETREWNQKAKGLMILAMVAKCLN